MKEDTQQYNDKGQPHGLWVFYLCNNKLYRKCVYINGKVNGFEEIYWCNDGKVSEKIYYL